MPSHAIALNWTRSGESITKSVTVTADGEHNVDVTVNAATTDKQVDIALDVSEIQSLYISSDKDITIETNAVNAAGGNTLTVGADEPMVWYAGCGLTNPLTADVTVMYITNAGASAATVKIRILEDVTP